MVRKRRCQLPIPSSTQGPSSGVKAMRLDIKPYPETDGLRRHKQEEARGQRLCQHHLEQDK